MRFLLASFNEIGHPKIMVFGDSMLDKYIWQNAERIKEATDFMLAESGYLRLSGKWNSTKISSVETK